MELRDALESMVYQFAYRGTRDGKPIIFTGGLSALSDAFKTLGWDDPYYLNEKKGGKQMTIDEAIETLQVIIETGEYEGEPHDTPALQLGIEALRWLRCHRIVEILPGETEE